MKFFYLTLLLPVLIAAYALPVHAQNAYQPLITKQWDAQWIRVPGDDNSYEVELFRKTLDISAKPVAFIVHVSGDNRYKLYVNGRLVSVGPARGDVYYWNYETVDLAPYLTTGKNVISAVVFNEGTFRPVAQISFHTGFILQGDTPAEEVINTNNTWKCYRDNAHQPLPVNLIYTYYVAGPGETVNMKLQPKLWQQAAFDDSNWPQASKIFAGEPKGVFSYNDGWMLVPSPIPARELIMQRLKVTRKAEGVTVPANFPAVKKAFTVPANTSATILLDQTFLTNAYPTIIFSKGKNAAISMSYAEGLYIIEPGNPDWKKQNKKGNRNEIEGKRFVGRKDSIISDDSDHQEFTPFNWRTYRYLQLTVETKDEPLTIDDLYGTATGYPFKYNARFDAGNSNNDLSKILDIGWHTARLCSWETYMDCPYYEQLQYIGDTRIQALVSYYDSGDDRLARNAIDLLDHSRIPEGITQSRYPTALPQQIPTFSLWWIAMLHDYYMYRPDSKFLKNKIAGMRQVLTFFNRYQQPDGSLKNPPYWEFTDWATGKGWDSGIAPIGASGNSAELDMQLLWGYQLAAELETAMGSADYALKYKNAASQLKQTIRQKYWDSSRQLYADRPEKDVFSQHANALAILTGVANPQEVPALANKLLTDTTLVPASIYFKYYLYQALIKAGRGDEYINWLGVWKDNLKMGMTTLAEISDISGTRSDCHAWGASPNIELFRTLLGIDSDAPGFSKVKIEPHLGAITHISGSIPHPGGEVKVSYAQTGAKWNINISLPDNIPGRLIWKGKEYTLKGGTNSLVL